MKMKSSWHVMAVLAIVIGWIFLTLYYANPRTPIRPPGNHSFIISDYTDYSHVGERQFIVGNCLVTQMKWYVNIADAVVIFTRSLKSKAALPNVRHSWQRWVWLMNEAPQQPPDYKSYALSDLDNVFNWTMTYRSDSDVPIPYGWITRKKKPDKGVLDLGSRQGLTVAVISNCNKAYVHNHRLDYIVKLNKTIAVTVYGACGERLCNGFYKNMRHSTCPEIQNFLFYLAFENSNCREYITEKLFDNGFNSGAVPVVMGATKEEYAKVTHRQSFIHVDDFANPQQLGEYLMYLSKNKTAYMEYHEWRKTFTVHVRQQFISKSVWEPLCNKLNINSSKQVVTSIDNYWSTKACRV